MSIAVLSPTVRLLLLCVPLLVGAAGCGGGANYGKPLEISGKVIKDGQPVADAQVTFHAMQTLPAELRTRVTKTDADGEFSIPDVYPGEYKVMVQKLQAAPVDPGSAPAEMSDDPLARFGADSPLKAVVGPDKSTEFNFDLSAS